MASAYGQFDVSDALIRFGHTIWVRAPEQALTAITGAWAGSFRDRTVESPNDPGDFTAVFHLTANDGGCLLYTSDAADDLLCVDLGGRRIIKKKHTTNTKSTTCQLKSITTKL